MIRNIASKALSLSPDKEVIRQKISENDESAPRKLSDELKEMNCKLDNFFNSNGL